MSWLLLILAIGADVAGTAALDRAADRRRRRRTRSSRALFGLAAASYLGGLWAFARALESIPTAVADAIFFAGATAVLAIVGVVWLGETLSARRAVALTLIAAGVVVLRLDAGHG